MEPVALQIQTPDSFKTIGSVLDFANKAQNLRTNQQAYESQNIDLQKQRQANQERIATQQFMSQPDNFQTNGRIDLDKINAALPQIAPLTGSATIDHLTKLATAQTGAEQAKLAFTGTERNIVAGLYGVLGRGGVDDPKIVDAEMDHLKTQYPDLPNLHKYIDSAKVGLTQMPAGKGLLNKTLINQSQSLLTPEGQQVALSPTAGTLDTGQNIQQVTTQPAVGGNAPSITAGPRIADKTVPPQVMYDSAENPYVLGADGKIHMLPKAGGSPNLTITPEPIPGSKTPPPKFNVPPPPSNTPPSSGFVNKPQAEGQSAATGTMVKHFEGLQDQSAAAPLLSALQGQVKNLVPGAITGSAEGLKAWWNGMFEAFTPGTKPTGDWKTDSDLLEKSLAQMNLLTPATTDAARTLISAGRPGMHMSKEALTEATDQIASQVRANMDIRNYLQQYRFAQNGAGDVAGYQKARAAVEQYSDPRVWQWMDLGPGSAAASQFLAKQKDHATLVHKIEALEGMGVIGQKSVQRR